MTIIPPETPASNTVIDTSFKHKVFKGSVWSFIASSGRQGFGLIVFIILSRLLSPSEFGLMAMAVAVVELLTIFVSLGLAAGIVRHPKLTETDKNTAFWLNVGTGLAVGLLIFVTSGLVSGWFKEHSLIPMLQWLALLPMLQGFAVVPEALLQRDMSFKKLAVRTLAATSGAGIVSIIMAFAGFGVYSLVFQRVATQAILLVSMWTMLPWRPRLEFSKESASRQSKTGLSLLGSTFLGLGGGRMVDVIIGATLGPAALGFYRVAGKLNDFIVQFLIDPLVNVALSSFSKVQHDKAGISRMYRRLTQFCGLLTFPAFLGLAVMAPEVTRLIFGTKWAVSGELMQILCLASLSSTLNYFYKPLMTALNHTQEIFKSQLLQFVLIVIATLVGSRISIHAVIAGHVAVGLVITFWNLAQIRKQVGITFMSTVHAFMPPVVSSVAMAAAVFTLKPVLAGGPTFLQNPMVSMGLLVATGILLYTATMLLVFRKYVHDIRTNLVPVILSSFKKRKKA